MNETFLIETVSYALRLPEDGSLEFNLQDGRGAIIRSPRPLLLCPSVAGVTPVLDQLEIMHLPDNSHGMRCVRLRCPLSGTRNGWVENTLYSEQRRLVVRARYQLDGAHALERWEIVPAGAMLLADTLQIYMGQHPTSGDGRILDLSNAEFSTASHNWAYCSLAPRVLLKRRGLSLCIGGTAVHHDYGLLGKVREGKVESLYFDYGGKEFPHPMADGGPHDGPRLQLQITNGLTDHQAHAAFTRAMIDDGVISPKRYRPEDDAWERPWYCTWGDQMWLAGDGFRQNVSGGVDYQKIKAVLTHDWILETARRIRAEKLNIGTFIIDDGWQDYRGDWNLVVKRIPDMRKLVDELHSLDFKVVLWWAPVELEKDARNLSNPELVSGPSRYGLSVNDPNPANTTIFDYSKPVAQEWLRNKLHLWFGSEPGNWHIDGLKIDFFMEKIAPSSVRGDVNWRGEEQLFTRLYKLIYETASRYTESPGIMSGPWNPHLIPYLTTVFLEERFDTDYSSLYSKEAIRDAMMPGMRITPHFVYYPEANTGYLRAARYLDAVPQIGVLQAPAMTAEALDNTRQGLAENFVCQ